MMLPTDIMTTEIDIEIAEDLFSPNNLIELTRTENERTKLAGIRFETRAGANESRDALRRRCFDVALKQLHDAWPQMTIWLFACHSTWQYKSAVPLYRRLWKSLEASNVVLPSGERVAEVLVDSPPGVRFFGLVHVPAEECERAYNVLATEQESFIVASTTGRAPNLDEHVLAAWQRRQTELVKWAELAVAVCGHHQVLFRPFGFFDDVEVGVDAILEPGLLRQWNSRTT